MRPYDTSPRLARETERLHHLLILRFGAAPAAFGSHEDRIEQTLLVHHRQHQNVFAFTLAQNEFLYALIFLTTTDVRTVPVGAIAELVKGDVFYWGQLMAAALAGSVPVAIIYSFFVEHYVAGLTAGAVKQ